MGYGGYAGWPDPEAGYDFQATGGSGKKTQPASSQPAQTSAQIAEEIVKAIEPDLKEEKKLAEQLFGADNPFVFDEYSAKQLAQQQYEPYYSEMLKDYLDVVGVKRESLAGDQQLLQALKTTPQGTAGETTRAYERAVAEAEKGFAGRGMFFSGTKKRTLGAGEVEREQGLQQTALETQIKNRDIFGTGRAYETAVEGGIEQRRIESEKEFYMPRVMEYARRFPSESNLLAGYVPSEYLRY
jgi:hypothetical protein